MDKKSIDKLAAELKNAAAQIMAAATQIPGEHRSVLSTAAKTVFEVANDIESAD